MPLLKRVLFSSVSRVGRRQSGDGAAGGDECGTLVAGHADGGLRLAAVRLLRRHALRLVARHAGTSVRFVFSFCFPYQKFLLSF